MSRYALLLVAAMTVSGLMTWAWAGDKDAAKPSQSTQASPPPPPDADPNWGGAPPPRHDSMRGDGPQGQLTPQQIEETIEVMRDMSPWLAEKLEEARKENPQKVDAVIRRFFPRYREFMDLKRHDPELYELRVKEIRLDMESRKLAWRIRTIERPQQNPPPPPPRDVSPDDASQAPEATPEELRQQLRTVLGQLFDIHRQTRQHEIEMLKQRIKDLEGSLADSRDRREQMIDQRLEDLLEQASRGPRWWQRGEGGPPGEPGIGPASGEDGQMRDRRPPDRMFNPGRPSRHDGETPPPTDAP